MNNEEFNMEVVDHFFRSDYQDRGMMKWQGFYLSDHNAALDKRSNSLLQPPKRGPQQSLALIKNTLNEAYRTQKQVIVQLNSFDIEGNNWSEISTYVHGYNDSEVMIDGKRFISLMDIRNLHFSVVKE